jgi:hypothetical protein
MGWLSGRFVLVLVVVLVLVLESGPRGVMEYWSVGVMRQLGIAPRVASAIQGGPRPRAPRTGLLCGPT